MPRSVGRGPRQGQRRNEQDGALSGHARTPSTIRSLPSPRAASRNVCGFAPSVEIRTQYVQAKLFPCSRAVKHLLRAGAQKAAVVELRQPNSRRRNARPSTAIASCEAASGRHTEAAVAIVSFSAVKDSITIGPL